MKHEDVVRMALAAGFMSHLPPPMSMTFGELHHFVNLVAAAARAEERQAMIDEAAKLQWAMKNEDHFEDCVREVAASRARSDESTKDKNETP